MLTDRQPTDEQFVDAPGRVPAASRAASLAAVASMMDSPSDMGQQLLLIAAIRRHSRIDLSDAEIKDLICEAIEEGWQPAETLARLVALDDGSDGIRSSECCPR